MLKKFPEIVVGFVNWIFEEIFSTETVDGFSMRIQLRKSKKGKGAPNVNENGNENENEKKIIVPFALIFFQILQFKDFQ